MEMVDWMFIFATEGCCADTHRMSMATPGGQMTVVGVNDHDEACRVAKAAADDGIGFIELCGDFGADGCRKVLEAVEHRVPVGYVSYFPEEWDKLMRLFGEV